MLSGNLLMTLGYEKQLKLASWVECALFILNNAYYGMGQQFVPNCVNIRLNLG